VIAGGLHIERLPRIMARETNRIRFSDRNGAPGLVFCLKAL
jgi:hypothetical protein